MVARQQPGRLAAGDHAFTGIEIDRKRPLTFRLNGRTISGFAGDTVLSAILANGITGFGNHDGAPLAIGARFAPAIAAVGATSTADALPMGRTPAVDGMVWRTIGFSAARALFGRLFNGRGTTLGLQLDGRAHVLRPWLDAAASEELNCDLIIVGGGVAGMSAAAAAGKLGVHVALIEREAQLGGGGAVFGTIDGEESPSESVTRLSGEIAGLANVTVLRRTEAFGVREGCVDVHVVDVQGNRPTGKIVTLRAKAIILATGTLERRPVFAGNRLPGVIGAVEAYELARRFGVWTGGATIIGTASSAAYRLATQARDAGVDIQRIVDSRANPQSRFIEFAKAYGLTQVSATSITGVDRQKGELSARLGVASFDQAAPTLKTRKLVVSGGFQPDLTLWLGAGGACQWIAERNRLEAGPGPAGIVLAGAAAGWLSRRACQQSGADAVDLLFKRKRKPIVELQVDPIYETPDGVAPATVTALATMPAYLDDGESLIAVPPRAPRAPTRKLFARQSPDWRLADSAEAFALGDVLAGVQLGSIAPEHAGVVALERTSMGIDLGVLGQSAAALQEDIPSATVPDFLRGRFGPQTQLWQIEPREAGSLDEGALIYPNSDSANPIDAIGVVLQSTDGKIMALLGKPGAQPGDGVTVRVSGRDTAARLVAEAS